ncbi:hypothetical protein HELRODRAFT_105496 [Helobdella robusta]|uniref:Rho-GAP domain-containing protein n=1 Tax=Helobdella robusta TaxID=6412 RepID=T1EDV7_HELRO|nr:hypothetical protein HELRODRAFT_105496 [Helobdella robusta]ESO12743.1 hypothetical protein HELRODRAFT_105496 [Helobdella robusta]
MEKDNLYVEGADSDKKHPLVNQDNIADKVNHLLYDEGKKQEQDGALIAEVQRRDSVLSSNNGDVSGEEDNSDGLEFDLSGVNLASTEELAREELDQPFQRTGAMTPEGLIDEDFEAELGSPNEEDENDPELQFRDIAKFGIIQLAGDDAFGRKVIVVSACRLPPREELDHQKFMKYLKHLLDQYVESDYTVVYFHYGLNSQNKPSFAWLRQAYSEFDRKYKKNLKALYLVHPTNFIKFLWNIFRPIISAKFGRKVSYINYLHELAQQLQLDQLVIPHRVRDYDAFLLAKNKPKPVPTSIVHAPLPKQQFGVELAYIKSHNNGSIIPTVVSQCVEYLREHGLHTEGLFRRSANALELKLVQKTFNEGKEVDFSTYDIHLPAAILKSFLRQLPEPLLTYELYDHIIKVQCMRSFLTIFMRRILVEELVEDNYYILKYIISFLTEVSAESGRNKMNEYNLAIVFGPNLIWSKNQASLASISQINSCTVLLISYYRELFIK